MPAAIRTFTNKVSWRAFVLFVCCALVPVSALAVLSLRQVTTELRGQSERRLRRASKAIGLELHKRLLSLESALGAPTAPIPASAEDSLPRPFLGVALIFPDGTARPLAGAPLEPPAFTPDQQRHLAAGQAVLSTAPGGAHGARFFLSRAAAPRDPAEGILHGEINPEAIWMVENESALEPNTQLIVLNRSGQLLLASFGASPLPTAAAAKTRDGPAGQFVWNDGHEDFLGSYWALFLRQKYLAPDWVVVLNRPTRDIFAPIADFHRTFLLVALLSLLVILLLCFGQLRRILQPLDRLHDATRRLALGHLDTRVEIASGDEFEDLAASFNQMAGQLGRQFETLTLRQAVASALARDEDLDAVLQASLEAVARHLGFALVALWSTEPDGATLRRRAIARSAAGTFVTDEQIRFGDGEIGRVAAEARPCTLTTLPATSPAGGLAFVGHPLLCDGRVRGVLAAYSARPLDGLDLGGVGWVAEEIARTLARRQVADALRHSEAQVLQLQKMDAVGRLAGGVAHDFNNLLTVILGYAQLQLQDLPSDDPRGDDLRTIQKTASRAAELTQHLLAFSRKQVLAPALLDLNSVVAAMADMLRRLIGTSIELVVTTAPEPALVTVDRGQIEQVIMNLVVNARDAMPHGGRLTLTTELCPTDPVAASAATGAGQVVLRVADTGVGMDTATRARIFEPFFTTKAPGKGTGLGLATVYGIVTQSGGRIAVDSELGRGTTFAVQLPFAPGTPATDPVPAPPPRRGDETVLLVEDEHDVRVFVERVLHQQGYAVLAAGGPSAALRIAEEHPGRIHLLLTDLVMPEMGGGALATRLRTLRPGIAVLTMSGYSEYRGARAGAEADAPAFLQKPFTTDTLARAVRATLDAARTNPV